jgi:hypothetical protein
MIATVQNLGFLNRSLKGNGSLQEGDAKLVVPGSMQMVLEVPLPFQNQQFGTLMTVPPTNSFMWGLAFLYNVTVQDTIAFVGPGLWDIEFQIKIDEQAAISDPTSFVGIDIFPADAPTFARVLYMSNKQGVQGQDYWKVRACIEPSGVWTIKRTMAAGLGTAQNQARMKITGTRLF